MNEPHRLDYAKPEKPGKVVLTLFILGLTSGPIALGKGALFGYITRDDGPAIFGFALSFLVVLALGLMAFSSAIDRRQKRLAACGCIAGSAWFLGMLIYIGWALTRL